MKSKVSSKKLKQLPRTETIEFHELLNKVFTSVYKKDDSLHFINDTEHYCFTHIRSCCETVFIESLVGNTKDLENSPILVAEMTKGVNPGVAETWSFYKFATNKGWVDVRWFGESNGNYSEEAFLYKVLPYEEYMNLDWTVMDKHLPFKNSMRK